MKYHNKSSDDVVKLLDTDVNQGISGATISQRYKKYGFNKLKEKKKTPLIMKFLANFKEFMIIILMLAALVSFLLHEKTDAYIIFSIIMLNAVLSTIQEAKAEKSIDSLKSLSAPKCIVLRDGRKMEIDSEQLLPGDIVYIEAGNFIPADGRIIESSSLKVEESTLTGESVPVDKFSEILDQEDLPLGDMRNMLFSGTIATYGRAVFVVTSTGMDTELGKIADLMMEKKEELTPLQMKLQEIGKTLGILVLVVCVLIFGLGMIQGRDLFEMFFTAVSLAVAAIPEGLPAVVTIVLALGVQRLSKKNAVIRKLPAVETLGSSSVICSDKTGTLTQNKMTVMKAYVDGELAEIDEIDTGRSTFAELVKGLVLCNDASIKENIELGDPTETALVRLGLDKALDKEILDGEFARINELPFDSDRKMMTTVHEVQDGIKAYTKGACDEILKRCTRVLINGEAIELKEEMLQGILNINKSMAEKALRVLGLSYKMLDSNPLKPSTESLEKDMVFVGLVGMIDPPREEVKEAIRVCKEAGIRPVMITGDHKITATAIATELGILSEGDLVIEGAELSRLSQEELNENVDKYSVYARVSPANKVNIVKAWQSKNLVVAMTGDGVNDAPALRMAEIGTAMGKVGTDVSRSAASMVLMDDNFSTIVEAIKEGRGIYENIRKSIRYLLSCNIGEIILLFLAMILNMPVPLLPIHILWVNLVTDSLPALALGLEPMDSGLMKKKPRGKEESVFSGGLLKSIILEGLMVGLISLGVFVYSYKFGLEVARTMTFITIAFSQLVHSINVRSDYSVLFKKGLFSNRYSLMAILTSGLLQVVVVSIPVIASIFKVTSISLDKWIIVIAASLIPLIIIETMKLLFKNKE